MLNLIDRSKGCLFGGAIGDAFGYPIEFMSLEEIRSAYGDDGLIEPILCDGRYQISDDTQMSLLTADGLLLALTRYCTRGIAGAPYSYVYMKYRRWAQLQGYSVEGDSSIGSWLFDDPAMFAVRAPGTTCMNMLCCNNEPSTMDEPRNESKGCGGLMRVAPVGLFCNRYDGERAIEWAAEIAASTHGHPYGYMSAAILSSIIYHITLGESLHDSISNAEADSREYFHDPCIEGLCRTVDNAVELSSSRYDDEYCLRSLGEGWVAEETLAMAVFSCLRYCDDVNGCLRCAVNVTGDSDSIGSVAGNIIGAYLGIDKVTAAFDISKLECSDMIRIIAEDLVTECPSIEYGPSDRIWNEKYIYCRNPYNGGSERDRRFRLSIRMTTHLFFKCKYDVENCERLLSE